MWIVTACASRASVYTNALLLRKMLVGNSQTLCDLHRAAAGCAFVPNAFLMEFMIQWYIRWAQNRLTEPLKRKSADNDFVSTHCNLFTSL